MSGKLIDIARRRRREIEQIVRRKGSDCVDVEGLAETARAVRVILAEKGAPTFTTLRDRLALWAAGQRLAFTPNHIDAAARAAMRSKLPHIGKADEVAEWFGVTYAERSAWGLTTIGAIDANKRERAKRRKARKLERDRARAAWKRAERGAVTRTAYLAKALTATRPWLAEGISRRTWERRRRKAVASPSPTNLSEGGGGTCDTEAGPPQAGPPQGVADGRGTTDGEHSDRLSRASFHGGEVPSHANGRGSERQNPRALSRRDQHLFNARGGSKASPLAPPCPAPLRPQAAMREMSSERR